MVSSPCDVEEQQIGFDITHRPVMLDHRPMHGNRQEAAGETGEDAGS